MTRYNNVRAFFEDALKHTKGVSRDELGCALGVANDQLGHVGQETAEDMLERDKVGRWRG